MKDAEHVLQGSTLVQKQLLNARTVSLAIMVLAMERFHKSMGASCVQMGSTLLLVLPIVQVVLLENKVLVKGKCQKVKPANSVWMVSIHQMELQSVLCVQTAKQAQGQENLPWEMAVKIVHLVTMPARQALHRVQFVQMGRFLPAELPGVLAVLRVNKEPVEGFRMRKMPVRHAVQGFMHQDELHSA